MLLLSKAVKMRLKDINTLDDMVHVKAVVPESVMHGGYTILNADDGLHIRDRKNSPMLFIMVLLEKKLLQQTKFILTFEIEENSLCWR